MKSLIAGIVFLVALGSAQAASTETFVTFLVSVPEVTPVETPVEQKVVELEITLKDRAPSAAAKKRRRTENLAGRATCSGAFINNVGDIITAAHCTEGADVIEILTFDKRRYTAVIIATSTTHDLALLHIDRRDTAFFEIASSARRGETIFILGSPLGITDTLSTGVIARLDGDLTFVDCSALPGNSGSTVFNKDGELVGVLTAGFIVMYGTTHLNVMQGLDAVSFFINDAMEKRYGF